MKLDMSRAGDWGWTPNVSIILFSFLSRKGKSSLHKTLPDKEDGFPWPITTGCAKELYDSKTVKLWTIGATLRFTTASIVANYNKRLYVSQIHALYNPLKRFCSLKSVFTWPKCVPYKWHYIASRNRSISWRMQTHTDESELVLSAPSKVDNYHDREKWQICMGELFTLSNK